MIPYTFPSWEEVYRSIISIPNLEEKLSLMQEPRLNITPLFSLSQYIDMLNHVIHDPMNAPLEYGKNICLCAADLYKAHKHFDYMGNKSQSVKMKDLCKRERGFIISIDESAEEIQPEFELQTNLDSQIPTLNEVAEKYFQKYKKYGMRGMLLEQYLFLQLRVLSEEKKLETGDTICLLLGSLFSKGFPTVMWFPSDLVITDISNFGENNRQLRSRASIWGVASQADRSADPIEAERIQNEEKAQLSLKFDKANTDLFLIITDANHINQKSLDPKHSSTNPCNPEEKEK